MIQTMWQGSFGTRTCTYTYMYLHVYHVHVHCVHCIITSLQCMVRGNTRGNQKHYSMALSYLHFGIHALSYIKSDCYIHVLVHVFLHYLHVTKYLFIREQYINCRNITHGVVVGTMYMYKYAKKYRIQFAFYTENSPY